MDCKKDVKTETWNECICSSTAMTIVTAHRCPLSYSVLETGQREYKRGKEKERKGDGGQEMTSEMEPWHKEIGGAECD